MSRPSPFVTIVLGLALIGCTSHAGPEPTPDVQGEPEVETPPAPAVQTPAPVPVPVPEDPPAMTTGPFTSIRHKPFAGAIGHFDGDAYVDVLALCHAPERASLLLMRGSDDGSFIETPLQAVDASGLASGDFDDDGDLDVLLLDARGKPSYSVARNDGGALFSIGPARRIPGRYGGELRSASIADLDADGDLDAIVPLWDELRILLGDGTGEFEPGSRLASGRDPFATVLADLDGDGQLDLAATSGAAPATDPDHYDSAGASVWIYRGSARGFAEPGRVEVSGAHGLAAADLDGDGRSELVVSGEGGLTVIRDALGQPQAKRSLVATDGTLLLADLLGSAAPELITTSYIQARVHLLEDSSSRPFEPDAPKLDMTSIEAGSYVVGLFTADIARDGGRLDLVLLDAGPHTGPNMLPESGIEVLFSVE